MFDNIKHTSINQAIKALEKKIRTKEEEFRQDRQTYSLKNLAAPSFIGLKGLAEFSPRMTSLIREAQHFVETFTGKIKHQAEDSPRDFLKKIAFSSFGLGLVLGKHYRYIKSRKINELNRT